jgi:hypothetical protein
MNTKLLCHYDMGYLKDWLRLDALLREIDDITQDDLQKFIEEMYGDFEVIKKIRIANLKYINLMTLLST